MFLESSFDQEVQLQEVSTPKGVSLRKYIGIEYGSTHFKHKLGISVCMFKQLVNSLLFSGGAHVFGEDPFGE
jgi:hypothetical protein